GRTFIAALVRRQGPIEYRKHSRVTLLVIDGGEIARKAGIEDLVGKTLSACFFSNEVQGGTTHGADRTPSACLLVVPHDRPACFRACEQPFSPAPFLRDQVASGEQQHLSGGGGHGEDG